MVFDYVLIHVHMLQQIDWPLT